MIIKEEQPQQIETITPEIPPPYTPSDGQSPQPQQQENSQLVASSSSSFPNQRIVTPSLIPSLPRVNYLSINRVNSTLTGEYVLDPELDIPEALLTPLAEEEERKNLTLLCRNGSLKADVWVLAPPWEREGTIGMPEGKEAKKATIDADCQNGFLTLRIRSESATRKLDVKVIGQNGGVNVSIPRSFSGPLTTITPNGWVTFSSSVSPSVTTFSDIKSTKKCFIGSFAQSGYGQGEWTGSSLYIECHNGRVKISYTDDPTARPEKGQGLISRILGVVF